VSAGRGLTLGRIGYLNVLPVYHPLQAGLVDHDFTIVSGPPAELNRRMAAGELDVSAVSSIEYARRPQRYLLVPDLAIGSRGPVQSVALLSRLPLTRLAGGTVLVSSETHTSAALLRILLADHLGIQVRFETGNLRDRLAAGDAPEAVLAIGDDALALQADGQGAWAVRWDLGQAWREITGLPFIFGVWVMRRDLASHAAGRAVDALLAAKERGKADLERIVALAAESGPLSRPAMARYFHGLVYDLGPEERQGLEAFYRALRDAGEIHAAPALEFACASGLPTPWAKVRA
jgi:chorismate dehydratase